MPSPRTRLRSPPSRRDAPAPSPSCAGSPVPRPPSRAGVDVVEGLAAGGEYARASVGGLDLDRGRFGKGGARLFRHREAPQQRAIANAERVESAVPGSDEGDRRPVLAGEVERHLGLLFGAVRDWAMAPVVALRVPDQRSGASCVGRASV